MSEVNDGGSAFPSLKSGESWLQRDSDSSREMCFESAGGMTLRDYFAAKALAGILANEGSTADTAFVAFAEYAYDMADAMLAVREHSRRKSRSVSAYLEDKNAS